jgi:hypothetical protein
MTTNEINKQHEEYTAMLEQSVHRLLLSQALVAAHAKGIIRYKKWGPNELMAETLVVNRADCSDEVVKPIFFEFLLQPSQRMAYACINEDHGDDMEMVIDVTVPCAVRVAGLHHIDGGLQPLDKDNDGYCPNGVWYTERQRLWQLLHEGEGEVTREMLQRMSLPELEDFIMAEEVEVPQRDFQSKTELVDLICDAVDIDDLKLRERNRQLPNEASESAEIDESMFPLLFGNVRVKWKTT